MTRERLNETHREILKIYQGISKRRKSEDFILSRKEISKLFFNRPDAGHSIQKKSLLSKEGEIERDFRKGRFPYKFETERQAWTRRVKDQKRPVGDIRDWRERVGLRTGLRGIYSKKQEILRRGLKDLVKKGYLERSGSGIESSYQVTEKALKAKIPKF